MSESKSNDDGKNNLKRQAVRNPYKSTTNLIANGEQRSPQLITDFMTKGKENGEKKGSQNQNPRMGTQSQQRKPANKKVRERRHYQLACYASKPIPGQCQVCIKEEKNKQLGKAPPKRKHSDWCPRSKVAAGKRKENSKTMEADESGNKRSIRKKKATPKAAEAAEAKEEVLISKKTGLAKPRKHGMTAAEIEKYIKGEYIDDANQALTQVNKFAAGKREVKAIQDLKTLKDTQDKLGLVMTTTTNDEVGKFLAGEYLKESNDRIAQLVETAEAERLAERREEQKKIEDEAQQWATKSNITEKDKMENYMDRPLKEEEQWAGGCSS